MGWLGSPYPYNNYVLFFLLRFLCHHEETGLEIFVVIYINIKYENGKKMVNLFVMNVCVEKIGI